MGHGIISGPGHRPEGKGSRPGSNGGSRLQVVLMHLTCTIRVQAGAELPGWSSKSTCAWRSPKGRLLLLGKELHVQAQWRVGCKPV
eukprot:1157437-Pelagomonas_calceolata.AAC.11